MKVSIVIPTYNRVELLSRTLESIAQATENDENLEIIVSDDGSSDDTFKEVRGFEKRLNLRYVYAPDEGFRAARARNLGASIARGDILIFCDSGNIVNSAFVDAHRAAHRNFSNSYVIGYVYGIYFEEPSSAQLAHRLMEPVSGSDFDRIVAEYNLADPREVVYQKCNYELDKLPAPWALAWTSNVSVHIDMWRGVGGFDEAYRSWGVEDVDFALALTVCGTPMSVCRDAAVMHAPHERPQNVNESNRNNKIFLHQKFGLPTTQRFMDVTSIALNLDPP